MIKIKKNEELYMSLIQATNGEYRAFTTENMAFKAMHYVGETFMACDIRNTLLDLFGIDVKASILGGGLRELALKKFVSRKKIMNIYSYTKTQKYHNHVRYDNAV